MIDRRVFLKGIVGTGFGFNLMSGTKNEGNEAQKKCSIFDLFLPQVSLIVKVEEIEVYRDTRQFAAFGRCSIGGDLLPIDINFSMHEDSAYERLLNDIRTGTFYLMKGKLYMHEDKSISRSVYMIAPEFKKLESIVSIQDMQNIEEDFKRAGQPLSQLTMPEITSNTVEL